MPPDLKALSLAYLVQHRSTAASNAASDGYGEHPPPPPPCNVEFQTTFPRTAWSHDSETKCSPKAGGIDLQLLKPTIIEFEVDALHSGADAVRALTLHVGLPQIVNIEAKKRNSHKSEPHRTIMDSVFCCAGHRQRNLRGQPTTIQPAVVPPVLVESEAFDGVVQVNSRIDGATDGRQALRCLVRRRLRALPPHPPSQLRRRTKQGAVQADGSRAGGRSRARADAFRRRRLPTQHSGGTASTRVVQADPGTDIGW